MDDPQLRLSRPLPVVALPPPSGTSTPDAAPTSLAMPGAVQPPGTAAVRVVDQRTVDRDVSKPITADGDYVKRVVQTVSALRSYVTTRQPQITNLKAFR